MFYGGPTCLKMEEAVQLQNVGRERGYELWALYTEPQLYVHTQSSDLINELIIPGEL